MRIKATTKTAVISGFFLIFALSSIGALFGNAAGLPENKADLFFIAAPLFFVLLALFVIGVDNLRSKLWNPLTKEYWEFVLPIIFRMLFFFLGAATLGMAYAWGLNELVN